MLLLPLLFDVVMDVFVGALSQGKEVKSIQIVNEEVKLSLFTNDMIVYVKNPMKLTKSYYY